MQAAGSEDNIQSVHRQLTENWQVAAELDQTRAALRSRAYIILLVVAALVGALAALTLIAPPTQLGAQEQEIARVLTPSLLAAALLLAVYYLSEVIGRFNLVGRAVMANRQAIETALGVLAVDRPDPRS